MKNFIFKSEFDNIRERINEINEEIKKSSFNIFTISSVNSQKENYHSDIIALLLSPLGLHKGKESYLNLFLDFLISCGANIDKENYKNVEVKVENPTDSEGLKGRIDILVRDKKSRHCIILENKINNAGDTLRQLEKYYTNEIQLGYTVDSIVYLPLNEKKKAPLTSKSEINKLIINTPAFSNKYNDLYHGWLMPCYEAKINESATSFIYEYSKLLKHLSKMGLDREIKNEFYEIISEKDGLSRVQSIVELANGLNEYRADVFMEKLNSEYLPFKKSSRYKPNYWLFIDFWEQEIEYKLDVQFISNGVKIDFWNPNKWFALKEGENSEDVREILREKLREIDLFNDFQEYGYGNGMYKILQIQEGQSIKDLDNEVLLYIQDFFKRLRGA